MKSKKNIAIRFDMFNFEAMKLVEVQKFTSGAESLADRVKPLVAELSSMNSFVVGLQGDLGAGKTFLVREILALLGLDSRIPVLSPTYSLINEYKIDTKTYIHADLYKSSFASLDQNYLLDYPFDGMFVEWTQFAQDISFTHMVNIIDRDEFSRDYLVSRVV